MQEVFTTPYFCAEQQTRWYERSKDSRWTNRAFDAGSRQAHGMVIVVRL